MASLLQQFVILTSLISVLIFISDLPDSLANRVYHNEEYEDEGLDTNCNRASSKRPCYNPFGYKKCGLGKFRFDWMREKRSFICKRGVGSGSCRSGSEELEELDDHTDEYRPIGKPRVTRGFFADLGEFPSFVQTQYYNGSSPGNGCGGTLINEYLVLTAAHCLGLNYTQGHAYAGSIDLFKGQRRPIKRACLPKEHTDPTDAKTRPHDWAILEIDGQFELSRNVRPACVNFDYKLAKDIKCLLVGFGWTDDKNTTTNLLKAAVVEHVSPYVNERGLIWTSAVYPEVGGGIGCLGDSGGPLFCYENCSRKPKVYVVGVASFVSWMARICAYDNQFVFVNTVNLRKLIPSMIKEMMDKREKQSVVRRRRAPKKEMDSTPTSSEGFRCIDFEGPNEDL